MVQHRAVAAYRTQAQDLHVVVKTCANRFYLVRASMSRQTLNSPRASGNTQFIKVSFVWPVYPNSSTNFIAPSTHVDDSRTVSRLEQNLRGTPTLHHL